MKKILSLILMLFNFGCVNYPIIHSSDSFLKMQTRNDYELLRSVYMSFSDNRLRPLEINFLPANEQSHINYDEGKYIIYSQPYRGIVLHELLHYFSYHVSSKPIDWSTLREEFMLEATENIVNGVSAKNYDKYFISTRNIK